MELMTKLSSGLNSTDIVAIIDACSRNKVVVFSLGDMSIRFDLYQSERDNDPISVDVGPIREEDDVTDVALADMIESAIDREDLLDQLKLTDPAEWERLIMKDDVEND